MGRTRIELLSSGDIELYDDVPSPITFSVADIREPDKRNSHFTKTIKVPATKTNNKLLGHLFDISQKGGIYNPNLKKAATLFIDDVPQLEGYLQVLGITIDDKGKIDYEVAIKGNVGNIFQALGDRDISDIDLSAFNHTLTYANQVASYTNDYTDAYCYPLIDYGYNANVNQYAVEHIHPCIFVRTLIDKIFSNAGYTYVSNFFDSAKFKNLIVTYANEGFKLSDTLISARLFSASNGSQKNLAYNFSFPTPANWTLIPFDTDVNDPANAFNTGTSKWTVPSTGYYDITCEANLNTSGSIVYGGIPAQTTFYARIGIRKNTNNILIDTYVPVTPTPTIFSVTSSNVYLVAGDVIDCCVTDGYQNFTGSVQLQFNTTNSVFKNQVSNANLQVNDTVLLNDLAPRNIKQKDFLRDIVKMFNLYVEVDKNNSNRLFIDPRDDFYASGTIVDWTTKLDNSNPVEVIPMGDLNFKSFKYAYKDDKDFYNKKYTESYDSTYGTLTYDTNNEFLQQTNETKVMFSPTPLAAPTGDDRVISRIFDFDGTNVKTRASNIRLLYNGGSKTATIPFLHGTSASGTLTKTYLYAGHLDSPTAPTFDLNFGVPAEIYYDTTVYTNGNLFNNYHKKFIEEISDSDSKIVIAYFRLRPYDIAKLDFRNRFYFEGQYFRLNKIYDYNPISEEVTKCEFIKIKEGLSFGQSQGSVVVGGWSPNPDTTPATFIKGSPRSNVILGNNNVLGGGLINSIITGEYNYVSGGNNINLIGSSGNTVYDGLSNVTLINTFNTTVTSGDVFYVNGQNLAEAFGEWNTQPYNSTEFTADIGSVSSSAYPFTVNRYNLKGKTMSWSFYSLLTPSTTPTILYIRIPNGKTSANLNYALAFLSATAKETIQVNFTESANYVELTKFSGGTFESAGNTISFTITFEIE